VFNPRCREVGQPLYVCGNCGALSDPDVAWESGDGPEPLYLDRVKDAPDCSTLHGALIAAGRKIMILMQTDKDGTLLLKDDNDDDWTCCVTEADACSFIARKYVEFTEREAVR